jgi:hypothetical protein
MGGQVFRGPNGHLSDMPTFLSSDDKRVSYYRSVLQPLTEPS